MSTTPFSSARFIWRQRRDAGRNRYYVFQREFRLGSQPSSADLKISAYSHYLVTINGQVVGRGPDPSSSGRYYYDTYAIQKRLRRGRNVLRVLAYAFGPKLPWPECAFLPGESGWLIFELEWRRPGGAIERIGSDAVCRVCDADAWEADTPAYTELRAGCKEYYDARRTGYDLLTDPMVNPRGWCPVFELDPADLKYRYRFLKKEIAPFVVTWRRPVAAGVHDWGSAYGFSKYRKWQIEDPETLVQDYPVEDYDRCLRDGEPNLPRGPTHDHSPRACTVRRCGAIGRPTLDLDFGGLQYGYLHLDLETDAPGSVIEIGYGESRNITYIDRYTTRAGRQTFHPFHARVGRHVLLTFSKIQAPIRIHGVRFERIDYPVKSTGVWHSSAVALDRIVEVSRETVRLNMHSHFEDCPWREQKLYPGDLYVEALACYYQLGDYDYVAKCLRQLAASRLDKDGWIPSAGPGYPASTGFIIEFPLFYVLDLRDHHLFSGDRQTLAELYPVAVAQIRPYLKMMKGGLIDIGRADSFENWCFINWNTIVKRGRCAAVNFLFARALAAAREMAGWLGRAEDEAWLRGLLHRLKPALAAAFWDRRRGIFRDACDRGRPVRHFSTETNTLAVLSGALNAHQSSRVLNALEGGRLPVATPTAYYNAFTAEALFRHGRAAAALALIRNYWGAMLARGADAFWEIFLPSTPPGSQPPKFVSLCHGFSGGPAYLLPAYVMGIRPLEPGFRRLIVDPQLAGGSSLEGVVPTPHGPITFRCHAGQLRLRHPGQLAIRLADRTLRRSGIDRIIVRGDQPPS